jgi:hypothetical protein
MANLDRVLLQVDHFYKDFLKAWRRVVDSAMGGDANAGQLAWVYLVVGVPLLVMILKRGFSQSFTHGDAYFLLLGVAFGAIVEAGIDLTDENLRRSLSSVVMRATYGLYALVVLTVMAYSVRVIAISPRPDKKPAVSGVAVWACFSGLIVLVGFRFFLRTPVGEINDDDNDEVDDLALAIARWSALQL